MKKSRKILSMILSAAMACSMFAMPVLAEDDDTSGSTTTTVSAAESASTIKAEEGSFLTSLPFVKLLKTNGISIMTNTTFTFTMVPDTVAAGEKKNNLDYYTGVLPKDADDKEKKTVTNTVNANSLNNVATYYKDTTIEGANATNVILGLKDNSETGIKLEQAFTLSDIPFDKQGVYRYKVTETAESKSSNKTITYDSTVYIVDLYVGLNTDTNKLGVEYAVSQTQSGTKKPIVFENEMLTSNLKIEKQIDGSQAKTDDVFTFWIKIPEGGDSIVLAKDLPIAAKITESGQADKTVNTIKVGGTMEQEDSEDEDYDSSRSEANGWCKFQLTAGQSLEIIGLPATMVYYLYEEDYQADGYDTTHIVKYDTTTPAKSEITLSGGDLGKQTTVQGANYVGFLNTKNSNPGTGIVLDIMPYVVIVLAAAACAVLFIARKRRITR
jgi:pilin isopeptide linkage protein